MNFFLLLCDVTMLSFSGLLTAVTSFLLLVRLRSHWYESKHGFVCMS